MVMEHIEGVKMNWKMWASLKAEQQEKIHSKISEQLQLLRSVPSEGYYGRVNNQGFHPTQNQVFTGSKEICGPYRSYNDLVSVMYDAAELIASVRHGSHGDTGFFTPAQETFLTNFKTTLKNFDSCEPKLTHVDPSMQNWIVRPLGGSMQDASDYEMTYIDWDRCGWYPAWVQRVALEWSVNSWDRVSFTVDKEGEGRYYSRVDQYFSDSYDAQVKFHRDAVEECSFGVY